MRLSPLVLASVLALLVVGPNVLSAPQADGHWEVLGEDGAVWVPATRPAAAALPPPDLGAYHTWEELTASLQSLAAARPDLATLASLGKSVEGRDVWALTLRAGPDSPGRPAVLFDGAHHGDEVIASEILLRYAQALVGEYPATERSRAILENVTLVIVPMVNPDGVARAPHASHYAEARKNARSVDLNRNYPFKWGGTGAGASPGDATYRGPAPASEPETQAMVALLDSRPWTFYSSLHSGAEMILWPWGWTTTPPPENALYAALGNELTAVTQAPNGQVSRILYGVSGDSMDHAYGGPLPGWRPIATSPETYEGAGDAFNWWPLFNPPDAQITSVTARWTAFLDHLAREAPKYAPATLAPPGEIIAGGEAFTLDAHVSTSPKRPLVGASALLSPPAFLGVTTQNPVALGAVNGTATASWGLAPRSGGEGVVTLRLDAGPAGALVGTVPVRITAPGVTLTLERTRAGSGQVVNATVRATGDTPLSGNATLRFDGAVMDARAVSLDGVNAAVWTVPLAVGDARSGARTAEIALDYVAADGAAGTVRASATLTVERADLVVTRTAPAQAKPGEPFLMTVTARNVGNLAARDITLAEVVPHGYTLAPRETGLPLPADPLARPAPKRATLTDDGRLALEWDVLGISPGGAFSHQLRLIPAAPGDHALETRTTYRTHYPTGPYTHAEENQTPQRIAA